MYSHLDENFDVQNGPQVDRNTIKIELSIRINRSPDQNGPKNDIEKMPRIVNSGFNSLFL
jgi:hypothetical protein